MPDPRSAPPATMEPIAQVAVQQISNPQPTNKVAAATNAGSSIAAVISGVMVAFGGPALIEMLGPWGTAHPNATAFTVALVAAVASWAGVRYGGRGASYNVLDAPNVPMVPAPSPTAGDMRP